MEVDERLVKTAAKLREFEDQHVVYRGVADPTLFSPPHTAVRVRDVDQDWVHELAKRFIQSKSTPEKIVAVIRSASLYLRRERSKATWDVKEIWSEQYTREVISGAHSIAALKYLQTQQKGEQLWKRANVVVLVTQDYQDDRASCLSLGIEANVVAGKVKPVSGGDVIRAMRNSYLSCRDNLTTKKAQKVWCSKELHKWQLTINRQLSYLRQYLDFARLPDETWVEMTPYFETKTFPVGVVAGLRPIGSPHPLAALKPLGVKDQVDLVSP